MKTMQITRREVLRKSAAASLALGAPTIVRAASLGKDGHVPMAVWYAVASLSVGLLAAWAGLGCGRRLAAEPGR